MKTLFKTYTSHLKAIEKRRWFEKKTGVKWNFHSTGNGVRFSPIVTTETPTDKFLAEKLLSFLAVYYQGFIVLSEISKMPLPDVLVAAQTLVKNNQAILGTNRMGNFAALRTKTKYEQCVD